MPDYRRLTVIWGGITIGLLFVLLIGGSLIQYAGLNEIGQGEFRLTFLVVLFTNGLVVTASVIFLLALRYLLMDKHSLLSQAALVFATVYYGFQILGYIFFSYYETNTNTVKEVAALAEALDQLCVITSYFALTLLLLVYGAAFWQQSHLPRWLAGFTWLISLLQFVLTILYDPTVSNLSSAAAFLLFHIWVVVICAVILVRQRRRPIRSQSSGENTL